MANTIRVKRRASGAAVAPAVLENAELAFNEVDNVLWYGKGTGGANGTATNIIAIGGDGAYLNLSGAQTITGAKTFTGEVDLSGATVSGFTTTGAVTIGGDLTVNGTTTTINSVTVSTDDKNIELGATESPTDASADAGGITLKGTSDKTITWLVATDAWTFSEHVDLAAGKSYYINGSAVLSATALGSGVTGSSLTSVGTLTSGIWQAGVIGTAYGGTGATDAATARANLGLAIGSDAQAWDADLDTLSGMQTGAAAAVAALTATEVAVIDGSTAATATTLALSDRMVINDAGSMVQVALSDLITFLENGAVSGFDIDGGTY